MCTECNSAYKLQKDPATNVDPITRKKSGTRRKAFYSYATVASGITVSMILKSNDVANLHPRDIELEIVAPGRGEEVESWKDVFGIDERFKAKCCASNDGKAWLVQVIDEAANVSLTPKQMLAAKRKSAAAKPYVDANFLKIPFLAACENAKIF
jgi:hypothetical protein